ncbi:MAG: hypothetical protein AB7G36_11690 [Candidatus Nanopelagicales bacterium]
MAAILRISVQNQAHTIVRSWEEPVGEPFLRFCRKASEFGVRNVDFIWPYADAMVNFFQIQQWLEDFPKVLDSGGFDDEERASALRVLAAAREAAGFDGYLWFEG